MSRLITNFGKRHIKGKLNRLEEFYKIEVVEVNSSYTSQECSSCGYLEVKDRKSTQEFECKAFGNKINAQVNSAKNFLKLVQ